MNKYQEALYIITDWFHSYENEKGVIVHERHITPKYEKAKTTLQELVEKETPKKVEYYYCDDGYGSCPKCHWVLEHERSYCEVCGQKLDWSDKDE